MKNDFFTEMENVEKNEIHVFSEKNDKNIPPHIVESDEISIEEKQISDSSTVPDYVKLLKKIERLEETVDNLKKEEV